MNNFQANIFDRETIIAIFEKKYQHKTIKIMKETIGEYIRRPRNESGLTLSQLKAGFFSDIIAKKNTRIVAIATL